MMCSHTGNSVAAATPVYDRSTDGAPRLLGVVQTDVSVNAISSDLLSVPQSKRGRSYAFLIDLHGRALSHPLLQESAAAPDISSLEVPLVGLGFEGESDWAAVCRTHRVLTCVVVLQLCAKRWR